MNRYTWRLKACPRCSGDLSFDSSEEHGHWTCIQCGYSQDNAAGDAPAPEKGEATEQIDFLNEQIEGMTQF